MGTSVKEEMDSVAVICRSDTASVTESPGNRPASSGFPKESSRVPETVSKQNRFHRPTPRPSNSATARRRSFGDNSPKSKSDLPTRNPLKERQATGSNQTLPPRLPMPSFRSHARQSRIQANQKPFTPPRNGNVQSDLRDRAIPKRKSPHNLPSVLTNG